MCACGTLKLQSTRHRNTCYTNLSEPKQNHFIGQAKEIYVNYFNLEETIVLILLRRYFKNVRYDDTLFKINTPKEIALT